MPKYISGRIKLRDPGKLTADRYRYLGLDQAEPNLGDPPDGTPPTAAIPSGERYQIISIEGHPGERYWIPVEGGIIPGSLTIYDEGTLVGGINSTTQLNFVGAAITASSINTFKETTLTLRDSLTFSFTVGLGVTQKNSDAFGYVKASTTNAGVVTITNVTGSFTTNAADELFQDAVGIARTPLSKNAVINASVASSITVAPYFSTNEQVTFNDNGEFNGAGGLVYRKNGAGDDTSVGLASVGVGTDDPYRTLHIGGDLKLDGTIYDNDNEPGAQNNILTKGTDGVIWQRQEAIITGAGGTIGQVQYHNDAGTVGGASNFYFDADNDRVGIGSTIPTVLFDVLGNSKHTGVSTFNNFLSVAAGSTFIIGDHVGITTHDTINGDDLIIETATPRLTLYSNTNEISEIKLLERVSGEENLKHGAFIRYDGKSPAPDNYLVIGGYDNDTEYKFIEAHRANTTSYALRFYNNNDLKFEVKNTGVKVTGNIHVTGGISTFYGDVRFDGQTADRDIYFDRSDDSLYAYDNAQFRVGTDGDVRIYHDTSNTYIEPKSDGVGDLIVGSATTDIAKFVYNGGVSLYYQDVLKFDTIGAGVTVYGTAILPQINTVGIATIDNVQIGHSDDNTINTSTGNLILDSADGTVQVNDVLYLNDTTQSNDATTGALRINGGAGIAKNLNVGGGVTTGGRLKINTHVDINSGFGTFIASVGAATTIDEFNVITSEFKTAEYTLHFEQTDKIHSQKVLVMIGGTTTAHSQEFAIMYHPDRMVSFDTTISAGICTLFATPQSGMTGLTTFRFSRSSLL
jgi:hypothetical protein